MRRLISLPLHIQIFIALVLGTLIGLLANPGKHTLPDGKVKISSEFHKAREIQVKEVFDILDPIADTKEDTESTSKLKKFFSTTIKDGNDFKRRYPFWTEKYNAADDKLWTSDVTNRSVRFTTLADKIQVNYTRQYDGKPILNQYSFKSADEIGDVFPEFYSLAFDHQNSLSAYVTSISKYIGDIFLRLLKMITIPLIVTSLVTGVAGLGGTEKLGRMFGRTILYYLTTSVLAITTGILLVNIIRPGVGATLPGGGEGVLTQESQSMIDIFLGLINNMIPPNPVAAFANGDFLSIITFSILFGVFIVVTGGKSGETIKNLFEALFDVVMRMTMFIIRLAPIGVLGFMVFATASQGLEIFATLAWYMLTVAMALLIHATIILPLLLFFIAKRNPLEYAKSLSPALMTAFSTASSNGTLPLTMTCVEERAGVSNKTSSFVLPLGATINMDGTALYEAVAVLFVAQASVGFSLGLETQIVIAFTALLASIGAAGIPHAGLVMMAIVLQAVGLPLEAQGIIIAVDRVLDMCRTTVNVWSDACGCAIIEKLTSTGNSSSKDGNDAV